MNTTPFTAEKYNNGIREIIPYYEVINQEVIDLVQVMKPTCKNRLDTGCGTGYLVSKSAKLFPESNFYMCDPANDMLQVAKDSLKDFTKDQGHFIQSTTQELDISTLPQMDVVTAILVHHFCTQEERKEATKKVFDLLAENGIYITVEIFRPRSTENTAIALKKLGQWELQNGRDEESVKKHLDRYDSKYFPITLDEHFELLKNSGFKTYDVFRLSNIQAGFYAIK